MAGKINDNYFLKLAKARKTTYEFNDKKVKEFSLKKIMEAETRTKRANIQPWHFYNCQRREKDNGIDDERKLR